MSGNWGTVALSKVAALSMGETLLSKNLTGDGVPVFSANTDDGPWGYTSNNRRCLRRGDIVIGARGSIGYPRRPDFDAFTCTQTTIAVEPYRTLVDSEYLHHALCAADILGIASQQAVPMLTIGALAPLEISLPPLDEQRRIAEVLRSVDEALEHTRLALDHLKALKQGTLHDTLAHDPLPEGWRLALIEELGAKSKHAIVDGPFGSNLKSEHYRSSGIPVFQSGFVTSSQFKPTKYVFVDEPLFRKQIRSRAVGGDILMAKIGAQAGRCAIIPRDHGEGIIAGNCLKITVDTDLCSNEFLHAVLTHMYGVTGLREIITETAQPAISLARLKKLQVPLPPLGEQHAIMEGIRALDIAYQAEVQKLSQLMDLKSCLMSDLLSGRVRVPA